MLFIDHLVLPSFYRGFVWDNAVHSLKEDLTSQISETIQRAYREVRYSPEATQLGSSRVRTGAQVCPMPACLSQSPTAATIGVAPWRCIYSVLLGEVCVLSSFTFMQW